MVIFTYIITLVICLIAISKGAIWLVDSASKLAKRFGVSELIIGLTIVAFGTSAPELGVTISAAIRGEGDISVGNIVGSNIFNLGIILGSFAIIRNLKTSNYVVYRDGFFLLIGSIITVAALWDFKLSRTDGLILFSLLLIYLWFLYHNKQPLKVEIQTGEFRHKDIFLLIFGLGLVLVGSHYLVSTAVSLAKLLGVSEWIIGTTIIAAGTSAPEIVTSIIASLRGHNGISIGNLIGSDIFNLFGALGLAATIRSLPVETSVRPSLIILVLMVVLALYFLRTKWTLSRREGIILVMFGLARWAYSLLMP